LTRSPVGERASHSDTEAMLDILESVGKKLQPMELKEIIGQLPKELVSDREKLTRFLLLVAFLDQQAESPTARSTAVKIHRVFGDDLFYKPKETLTCLGKLVSLKNGYKISPVIGRVLPRFGWFVLRVGGFLVYEMMLNKTRLSEKLGQCKTPAEAINFLHSNPIVESILRDKAVRMYISWIGHPDLGINVSEGAWDKSSFLMPVDGHVGKVFSRTGMVSQVIHERKKGKSPRWNIISASQMRPLIQEVVSSYGRDPIMVDHGAFQVGFNCCPDNVEGICCDSCSKLTCEVREKINYPTRCVLSKYCKRNFTWRAY
jgi:hypothetical protein